MSQELHIMKMKKNFDAVNPGEVAGFTPSTAAWLEKNESAELLGIIDPKTQRYDEALKKVVSLDTPVDELEELQKSHAEISKANTDLAKKNTELEAKLAELQKKK